VTIDEALTAVNVADILFVVCLVVALCLGLIGAFGVVRIARPLQRRLDEYADLPVVRALAVAQVRLEATSAALSEFSALSARANAALATIRSGVESLRATALSVLGLIATARAFATRVLRLVGLAPRASRSQGS
jgi:hypothetical protein